MNYIMRIKKILDAVGLVGNILNKKSDSKKDAYSCDYINKLNTYSTEEQRIGTWIDGKPLYGRAFVGTLPSDHNVLGIVGGVDEIVCSKGNIVGPDGNKYEIGKSANMETHVQVTRVIVIGDTLCFQYVPDAFGNSAYKVYIEYTKTTD